MKLSGPIETQRLILRHLTSSDVSDHYVGWLNDPDINQYLEIRFSWQDKDNVEDFVNNCLVSPNVLLLGIFLRSENKHIGNIKLGPINLDHMYADLGLVIGDRKEWGQGYATEAIMAVTNYAFSELKLNKLISGSYADNYGSIKAFLRSGWSQEGRLAAKRRYFGSLRDEFLLGITNERCPSIRFGHVKKIALIGAGSLLYHTAEIIKRLNYESVVVMAPFQAKEEFSSTGMSAKDRLAQLGYRVLCPDNIKDIITELSTFGGESTLALCFRPTWIFETQIRNIFGAGMYNLNEIPIPSHLGGSHFIWQLVNNDRRAGWFFQEITAAIDRGPVLRFFEYTLPKSARKPVDCQNFNDDQGKRFVKVILDDFINDRPFEVTPFDKLWLNRS